MIPCRHRDLRHSEAGGITIVVALMLLVLLTVAAIAMSRNSLREIVTSGFTRQGAMARNAADSGIEWGIYWIDVDNSKSVGSPTALLMGPLADGLLKDTTLSGQARDVATFVAGTSNPNDVYSPGTASLLADLTLPTPPGVTAGFTLGLTNMGKLPIAMTSQGAGTNSFTPAAGSVNKNAPDLWAIRGDAQVIQGGMTFVHDREAWISTPVRTSN
jgi:type II secretory pathway pseudopilin PulG